MAPNISNEEPVLTKDDQQKPDDSVPKAAPRQYEIVWVNVLGFAYYHVAAVYGLYLLCTSAMWKTVGFACFTYYLAALGVTAGAHRLWTHKAYKATLPLQIFLMLCHSLANQHSIFHWARDHRLHHKYSDTDADPHNATRGFFYSHVGWLLVKKHPEVKRRGKLIDLSDLYNYPVVMFQRRHQSWFILTVAFLIPTLIPVYCWSETYSSAFHVNMLRYVLTLNATFMVNSVAHLWGNKPYDHFISPSQNMSVTLATLGEGFHNFHHVFPHDYRTGELGNNALNFTTSFIDLCAKLGLAYDLKYVTQDVINQRMARTGDGTDLWSIPLEKRTKSER